MVFLKRVFINMKRNFGKTMLIFGIVFSIGILTSATFSITNAISVTRNNLRRQIPAVATINVDNDAIISYLNTNDAFPVQGRITAELINSIGDLPQVKMFDYALVNRIAGPAWGFFSSDLKIAVDSDLYKYNYVASEQGIIGMKNRFSMGLDHVELLRFKGVFYHGIVDIEMNLITLTSGRTFTEQEIQSGTQVVLISNAFAVENNLQLGDYLNTEMRLYDPDAGIFGGIIDFEYRFMPENIIYSEEINFKIIGLFEPTVVMDETASSFDFYNHFSFNNMIYAPIDVVRSAFDLPRMSLKNSSDLALFYTYEDVVFVLYDALYLEEFYEAASEVLPDIWLIHDLRTEYAAITTVLDGFQDITEFLVIIIICASVLILGLILTLLTRIRRYEIGVYLALGESKFKIMLLMISEFILISFIGITAALGIGHYFAHSFTLDNLSREILNNPNVFPNSEMGRFANDFYRMGFGVEMTAEEMFAAFDISLNATTILTFYITTIVLIMLSASFMMIYLYRINPKIMLESRET